MTFYENLQCNMKTNCADFHESEENKSITCHQIEPMSLTSLVTTDLIGISRGRSLSQSDLDKYYDEIGCGWDTSKNYFVCYFNRLFNNCFSSRKETFLFFRKVLRKELG